MYNFLNKSLTQQLVDLFLSIIFNSTSFLVIIIQIITKVKSFFPFPTSLSFVLILSVVLSS